MISGGNTAGDYRVALTGSAAHRQRLDSPRPQLRPGTNTSLTVYAYCLSGGSSN